MLDKQKSEEMNILGFAETEVKQHNSSGLELRLITIFAVLRRVWMVPYRIEYSKAASAYKTYDGTRLKKVVIWILQLSFTWCSVMRLIRLSKYDSSIQIIILFTIGSALSCWSNIILIHLWTARHSYAKIATEINKISTYLESRGANFRKRKWDIWIGTMLGAGCVLLALFEFGFFHMQLHKNERYLNPLVVLTKYYVTFQERYSVLKPLDSFVLGRVIMWILIAWDLIVNVIYYFSIGHFGYAVLFILCGIAGDLYKAHNSILPTEFASKSEIDEAIRVYTKMRRLTTEVNQTIGTLMAWAVLAHLPYNAYKVTDFLNGYIVVQISYTIHISMFLGILFAGANVHHQMNSFLNKISSDQLTLNEASLQSKVSLLLIQSKWAGMRGGGMFLITYGFLGNVVGVIITYAILIVQFPKK